MTLDNASSANSLRVFSFGGGVQSTAALVLAAQGEIDFNPFLFSNVGDDTEHPDTLAYVRDHAMPYAKAHGIKLIELRREWRDGRGWSLYQWLTNPDSRSIGIPVYMAGGAPGTRSCTERFKIDVIAHWLKQHGASRDNPATVGLGISLDEFQRMRTDSGIPHYRIAYPLIDLRRTRQDCHNIITRADLPIPPKSSCWMCPFGSIERWRTLRREHPDLYQKAVRLEEHLNERRHRLGRDDIYLTNRLVPLPQAVGTHDQPSLFEEESACESGYCMT